MVQNSYTIFLNVCSTHFCKKGWVFFICFTYRSTGDRRNSWSLHLAFWGLSCTLDVVKGRAFKSSISPFSVFLFLNNWISITYPNRLYRTQHALYLYLHNWPHKQIKCIKVNWTTLFQSYGWNKTCRFLSLAGSNQGQICLLDVEKLVSL